MKGELCSTHTHTHTHTRARARKQAHMCMYTHTHTHTHTHTQTHTCSPVESTLTLTFVPCCCRKTRKIERMGGEGEKKANDGKRRREGREKEMWEIYYTRLSEHRECKCNCVQLFQVGSHLQHSVCMLPTPQIYLKPI